MTTKIDLQDFEEDFFEKIREQEAWKGIAEYENLPWNLRLIEKWFEKLDWTKLCKNPNVYWTIELIEKYKNEINWDVLSENVLLCRRQDSHAVDWDIFRKFERYWNWNELSSRSSCIPIKILEEFASRWDWAEIIYNHNINWTYDLFEKFKKHIYITGIEHIMKSKLWDDLVKIDEQIILGRILSE